MNIVFIGPQGSGKGTQAEILAQKTDIFYLEAGSLVREKAKEDSVLGREINRIANLEGKLLPDEVVSQLVEEKLNEILDFKGVIFDGFPRSLEQAKRLEEYLAKKDQKINRVIFLTLSEEESIRRLAARRVCQRCGKNFNLVTNQPQEEDTCDACGGSLVGRVDDTPERLKIRLEEYQRQTAPLVDLWRQEAVLEEVDGERPIEVISQDIARRLGL